MNSQSRRLSSTAPVPERPPTKSSKPGMQNVFWTSTASRQTRKRVPGGRLDVVRLGPRRRLAGALLVGNPPDLAGAVRVEVRRQRELAHGRFESSLHPHDRARGRRAVRLLRRLRRLVRGRAHDRERRRDRGGRAGARRSARWRTAWYTGTRMALGRPTTEIAAAYAEIGAKWTVWVWPGDDDARLPRGARQRAGRAARGDGARPQRRRAPGARRPRRLDGRRRLRRGRPAERPRVLVRHRLVHARADAAARRLDARLRRERRRRAGGLPA